MDAHAKLKKSRAATRVLPEEDPEFQIAPMIDILLVLLVFFMTIATDQVMQVNQEVILPVAKDAEPPGKDKNTTIYVNVLWNLDGTGKIEVDDKVMEPDALTDHITRMRTNAETTNPGREFRVVIRADKRARYSYVRNVMVSIGKGKVPNVIFSAVDKEVPKITPTAN